MEANIPTPNETPTPQAEKNALDEAKAKFAELLASQRSQTAAKEEPASEPAKAEEPKEEPAPAPAEKKAKSPEVEKLRNKLLLAGNPKRAVESLDDEEVAEWWKRQEERERTAALALQRASDLERQLKEQATDEEPEEPQGVPTSDESDLEEIAASLSDQFGEDEAKALVSVLKTVIEPLRRENSEIKAIIAEAQKSGRAQLEQRNRDRLAKELPALKSSDAAWNAIQREAQERFAKEPKKYASPDEAYSESFKELYGSVLPAKSEAPDEDDTGKAKARIAASSHTTPALKSTPKKASPREADQAAFRHLMKNPGDTDGARRAYGSLLA
jgi:hypothetical protein